MAIGYLTIENYHMLHIKFLRKVSPLHKKILNKSLNMKTTNTPFFTVYLLFVSFQESVTVFGYSMEMHFTLSFQTTNNEACNVEINFFFK